MVCLSLFPAVSGASSTLELTDSKCLKTTPICPPYIFWVCAVSSRHGAPHISKGCWKAHLSQGLLRNSNSRIVAITCSYYVCETAGPPGILILRFWTDRQTGYWKGNFQMRKSKTNQQQLSCRSRVFHSVAWNEQSEVLLWGDDDFCECCSYQKYFSRIFFLMQNLKKYTLVSNLPDFDSFGSGQMLTSLFSFTRTD